MIRRVVVVAALLIAALGGAPAAAASFDCAKAKAADEIAICRSPALSELDAVQGAYWFTYSRVPMLMGSSGARRDDALAFLRARAACGADAACLTRAYHARIAVLRAGVDGAMTQMMHDENDDRPFPPPALPQQVTAIVTDFAAQCQRAGGTVPPGGRPRVMTADLDGDGEPDYVVDATTLQCHGAATALCANNGCQIAVARSGNRYFDPLRLAGGLASLTATGRGTVVLTLLVDRSECAGAVLGDACRATVAWDTATKRMAIRYDRAAGAAH